METNRKEFLCCPVCKGDLIFTGTDPRSEVLSEAFCENCNKAYEWNDGYLDFLGNKGLIHSSKQEKFVRSIYAKFYTPLTNFMFLLCGGVKNARLEVINHLEISDNDIVLETGMGPGDNFPLLVARTENLKIFGIDIQKQMLIHSLKNIRKWNIDAELFRSDAEELPFRDERFDVVFHLGAFNLFNDKKKALDEMIRVAKTGTRIVIADESEKGSKIFNLLTGTKGDVIPPIDLIPDKMLNITMETIWRGYGYVIAFTKP
ncbi:MAG TPA: methyltransferase domain-containing protein [Bacteroidales bacterium]|nr:methyltransferase domain-containing protein [Bacteroidales bacterium]